MTEIIRPGAGIVFMKVGTHAQEPLEDIIARKRKEIEDAGFALWGSGGNTCHPITRVQPFARDYVRRGSVIYLCMQPMKSKHAALPERAKEFSADGIHWETIPQQINVLGSRYALAIKDLHAEQFELPLERTRVAIGTSMGRPGSKYVSGRVDKACLEVAEDEMPKGAAHVPVDIGLVAELVEPYAVLLQ
jgi:hypothetical protein